MKNEIESKRISDNIRAERHRQHLTQEQVAKDLGITKQTYLHYEQDSKALKPKHFINLPKS